MAHLHGFGGLRRRSSGTLEAAIAGGRPFLAVGLQDGGVRAVLVAGLRTPDADALAADEALIVPALRAESVRLAGALARVAEIVLVVVEVPGGRHRGTRTLGGDVLERLRTPPRSGTVRRM